MLLSVSTVINIHDKNQTSLDSQIDENICGKIILIDLEKSSYKLYSKGLRNVIGMYSDDSVTLVTDNGPFGGDEINNQVCTYETIISKYKKDRRLLLFFFGGGGGDHRS